MYRSRFYIKESNYLKNQSIKPNNPIIPIIIHTK